jgi:hypothetical protein
MLQTKLEFTKHQLKLKVKYVLVHSRTWAQGRVSLAKRAWSVTTGYPAHTEKKCYSTAVVYS